MRGLRTTLRISCYAGIKNALVEGEPGRTLLDVIAFEQDLEELLGRSVGVLTEAGLSPYLQERILAEATVL